MRALITGISGFVGFHLAEHLQAAGDAVLGVGRNAPSAGGAVPLLVGDVGNAFNEAFRQRVVEFAPDVIYHLAALSIPRDCGDDVPTAAAVRTNVDGTRHVLNLARSLPRRPRVLFSSSSRVYAPVDPAAPLVGESSPVDPRTAYGKTKWIAEQFCREAVHRDGLDVVIIRSFSQSGPRMDSRLMLAEWAAQFVRGGEAPIEAASLDVTIDFLDVRDGVRALRLLAERGIGGETYNVGSGTPRTTGEVFRLLREQIDDRRTVREFRPGRRSDPIADVTKLRAATGWEPRIPLAQTVADVVADWRGRA